MPVAEGLRLKGENIRFNCYCEPRFGLSEKHIWMAQL